MINKRIVVSAGQTTQVKKVLVGTPVRRVSSGAIKFGGLEGIDMTNVENGDMLVYKASTNKWTSTKNIEEGQNINGGSY
jgi:hypothetical protein